MSIDTFDDAKRATRIAGIAAFISAAITFLIMFFAIQSNGEIGELGDYFNDPWIILP